MHATRRLRAGLLFIDVGDTAIDAVAGIHSNLLLDSSAATNNDYGLSSSLVLVTSLWMLRSFFK
jgi:hypothetical protein